MILDAQNNIAVLAAPGVYDGEVMIQAPVLVSGCHVNVLYSGALPEALEYALLPDSPTSPARVYAEPLGDGVSQAFLWWPTVELALADLREAGWSPDDEEGV